MWPHRQRTRVERVQGGQGPSWHGAEQRCGMDGGPHGRTLLHGWSQTGTGSRQVCRTGAPCWYSTSRLVLEQGHRVTAATSKEQGAHSPGWQGAVQACRPQASSWGQVAPQLNSFCWSGVQATSLAVAPQWQAWLRVTPQSWQSPGWHWTHGQHRRGGDSPLARTGGGRSREVCRRWRRTGGPPHTSAAFGCEGTGEGLGL